MHFYFCSDVTQTGFCTEFCGWHTFRGNYKYAWVGVPPTDCADCFTQTNSPNSNAGVDSAISVIGHELSEAVTDPTGFGWCYSYGQPDCFSSGGVENADQCAWDFPNSTRLPSGAKYNMAVGGKNYLVQSNWNLNTKTCRMS